MYILSQDTSELSLYLLLKTEKEFLQVPRVWWSCWSSGKRDISLCPLTENQAERNLNFPNECSDRLPWKLSLAAHLANFVRKHFSKFSWILKNFSFQ